MKDPVEFCPPSGNRLLITLRMEQSSNSVPPAAFDDLPLDLRHSPAIKTVVGEPSKPPIIGLTHVVNWFIASHTE